MGFFDFFKKKPQPQAQSQTIEERIAAELAEIKAEQEELGRKHSRNLAAIDWDAMVPGNAPATLSKDEIDFLGAVNGTAICDTKISKQWTDAGIDFNTTLQKLFSMGLVDWASLDDTLRRMKVTELKEVLAGYGMPVSGKKDALIERILTLDHNVLRSQLPPSSISLTDKGRAIVSKKRKQDRDKEFRQASEEVAIHLQEGDLSAYRLNLQTQIRVLMAERRFEAALELSIIHFVFSATGIDDLRLVELHRNDEMMKGTFKPFVILAPYQLKTIKRCMTELALEVDDLEERYRAVIQDDNIPCGVFTTDEGWELLVLALDDLGAAECLAKLHSRRFVLREGL